MITGRRGAGKSTLCRLLIEAARLAGWDVSGVLSPARVEDFIKTGIEVVDLRSEEQHTLAQRQDPPDPRSPTPGWAFDPDVLAWGNLRLANACPCDLLVVDELGPLELLHNGGWQAGIAALDGGQFRLALVVIRPELIGAARARWPRSEPVTLQAVETTPSLAAIIAQTYLDPGKNARC